MVGSFRGGRLHQRVTYTVFNSGGHFEILINNSTKRAQGKSQTPFLLGTLHQQQDDDKKLPSCFTLQPHIPLTRTSTVPLLGNNKIMNIFAEKTIFVNTYEIIFYISGGEITP